MPRKQGYKQPSKVGARGSAKFLKPGASREETGMAFRSGSPLNKRTVVKQKPKTMEFDDRMARINIKRK